MGLPATRLAGALPVVVAVASIAAPAAAAELPPLDRPAIDDALDRAYDDVDPALSPVDHIRRFLGDLLVRVLTAAFRRDDALGLLIALAAMSLLAAGLWWAYRRLGVVGGAPPAATPEDSVAADIDWGRQAAQARERGDLEAAVRAGWRHLLHLLDVRGVVDAAPSLTASETAAAARRSRPALAAAVAAAAYAFEQVVFADEPATSEHYRRVRAAVEQVAGR